MTNFSIFSKKFLLIAIKNFFLFGFLYSCQCFPGKKSTKNPQPFVWRQPYLLLKGTCHYTVADGHYKGNFHCKIHQNNCIWMTIRGWLGVEIMRILITPDAMSMISFQKKYMSYTYADVQNQWHVPLSFAIIHDILSQSAFQTQYPYVQLFYGTHQKIKKMIFQLPNKVAYMVVQYEGKLHSHFSAICTIQLFFGEQRLHDIFLQLIFKECKNTAIPLAMPFKIPLA